MCTKWDDIKDSTVSHTYHIACICNSISTSKAAEEDEEGWVTVSRSTKKTTKVAAKGTAKAQAKVKAREARKRKRKELENFYKYQVSTENPSERQNGSVE